MIKEYIKHLKKNNYSNNTVSTYKSVLTIYGGHLKDIRSIKQKLKSYFVNPNTAWTHYNIICSYLVWNSDKRVNTLKELKLPQIPMKYLEVFDKAFLLKKTEILNTDSNFKKNQKYVIKFLFETGLRASELLSIISYDKKTLLLKGKGNKIRQIFHNYETTSKITNLNITTKTLRIWVKNILGVKWAPHSIRRSFATHMLLKGAIPKMVMMQLGHTKVETTFRYLQLSIDQNKKLYDKYF